MLYKVENPLTGHKSLMRILNKFSEKKKTSHNKMYVISYDFVSNTSKIQRIIMKLLIFYQIRGNSRVRGLAGCRNSAHAHTLQALERRLSANILKF